MLNLIIFYLSYIFINFVLTINSVFIYNLLTFLNYSNWNLIILLYFVLYTNTQYNTFIYSLILGLYLSIFSNISFNILLEWPNTLNYGFNLIHPLLFYYILILIILNILCNKLKKYSYIKLHIYILSLSLTLGMYWGGINEGWGFFWTYDNIELSLLTLLLILTFYLHNINFFNNKWLISMFVLLLLFFILLLRYNLFFTVHSFFLTKKIFNLAIYFNIFFITLNTKFINMFTSMFKLLFIINIRMDVYFIAKGYFFVKYKNLYQSVYHYIILFIYFFIICFFYFYTIITLNNKYNYSDILIFINSIKNYFFFIKNINFNLITTYFLLNYGIIDNFFLNINNNYIYVYYIGFFYTIYYLWLISFLKIYNK